MMRDKNIWTPRNKHTLEPFFCLSSRQLKDSELDQESKRKENRVKWEESSWRCVPLSFLCVLFFDCFLTSHKGEKGRIEITGARRIVQYFHSLTSIWPMHLLKHDWQVQLHYHIRILFSHSKFSHVFPFSSLLGVYAVRQSLLDIPSLFHPP